MNIAALALCIALSAGKADEFEMDAIADVAAIKSGVAMMNLKAMAGDELEAQHMAAAGQADIDRLMVHAINSAKGHPDLIKALKDYHVALTMYLNDPVPYESASSRRLRKDVQAKEAALDLELKLATQ